MYNSTAAPHNETVGWVSADNDRGTADIIWSSCITIILCVWVSTYPNVPSSTDRWYHKLLDKINLAFIGFLGPDLLLGLAAGQWSSARRSVAKFNQLQSSEIQPPKSGLSWTVIHGFFTDMGGFHIISPDFEDGFPVNTEQLYYLVRHGFVDKPTVTEKEIQEMSNFDPLSKVLVLWQMLWFSVTVAIRVHHGYAITTLEFTAVTFAVVMLATSAFWFWKPQIPVPTYLTVNDMHSMKSIREYARRHTHPNLPVQWYRTPMDFASPRDFLIDKNWAYYSDLSVKLKLPLFHRAIPLQWDRIPSDIWYPTDGWVIPATLVVQLPFCIAFLAAWNFHFPSPAERLLWRIASVYHTVYSLVGTMYCIITVVTAPPRPDVAQTPLTRVTQDEPSSPSDPQYIDINISERDVQQDEISPQAELEDGAGVQEVKTSRLQQWAENMRNVSPGSDPSMGLPLRWTSMVLFPSLLYIFCRLYFYIEDFASLRSQPASVYASVPKILPFI